MKALDSISGNPSVNLLITVIIVLYSFLVLGTATPLLSSVPALVLILYYLLIPGFSFSLLISESYGIIQRILYSIPLSTAFVLLIFALRHPPLSINYIQFDIVIPIVTLIALAYAYISHGFGNASTQVIISPSTTSN